MSYILDALRRSEQERQQTQQVGVLNQPSPEQANQSAVPWLAVLLIANVALIGGLAWWLKGDARITPPQAPAANQTPAMPIAVVPPVAPAPIAPRSASQPQTAADPTANVDQPMPQAAAPALTHEIPTSLPRLEVSTHIYSSAPEDRAIIINGERLAEGEQHSLGFVVKEITERGARLEYQGSEFELYVAN